MASTSKQTKRVQLQLPLISAQRLELLCSLHGMSTSDTMGLIIAEHYREHIKEIREYIAHLESFAGLLPAEAPQSISAGTSNEASTDEEDAT